MMRKNLFLTLVLCSVFVFLLSLPVYAQVQEAIPVSGTFSYTWESPMLAATDSYMVLHGIEPEIWSGDFEGTADAVWRLTIHNSPAVIDVWIISEFEGTVLGEYEGTLTVVLVGNHPNDPDSSTQWYGEWSVIEGTGDLENVHGHGIWWGTGNAANNPDHDIPDIFYAGEIVLMEAPEA